jgi:hypothetical protein
MVIDKEGVTCAYLGYVEGKTSSSNGDLCATDESHWGLRWDKADKTWQDYTNTRWMNVGGSPNWIKAHGWTKGPISLCTEANLCDSTSEMWEGMGEFFVSWGSPLRSKYLVLCSFIVLQIIFDGNGLMLDDAETGDGHRDLEKLLKAEDAVWTMEGVELKL